MNFKDIVGHEDIIRHMKSSIELGKVSHAYLIHGEKDSGKKMLARTFAQTLNCEAGGINPCGECQSCKQAVSGNHPDIITVTHESPTVISVEEVREQLLDNIIIKPYKGKYKVYIVPDADLMTTAAQNALLKTIEEPPAYGVVILLASNLDRILSTVLSRCVLLSTKPVKDLDMLEYLQKNLGLTEDKAHFCIDFAQGNMGKAIKLAKNDEYAQVVESVVSVMKSIYTMDLEDLKIAVEHIEHFKLSINDYMDLMMMWYRDILMLKVTGKLDKLLFRDEYAVLKKQAEILNFAAVEEKIDAISRAKKRLNANAGFDVTMELLLFTLKEI